MNSPSPDFGAAAKLSRPRSTTTSYDRHETYEPTSYPQQRQQSTPVHQHLPLDSAERLSTPGSRHRVLRRTPRFEATPSPEPRRVHVAAASLGFTPRALSFDQTPPQCPSLHARTAHCDHSHHLVRRPDAYLRTDEVILQSRIPPYLILMQHPVDHIRGKIKPFLSQEQG